MQEVMEMLLKEWAGAPLAIWFVGVLLAIVLTFRFGKVHVRYKGREREISVEADR